MNAGKCWVCDKRGTITQYLKRFGANEHVNQWLKVHKQESIKKNIDEKHIILLPEEVKLLSKKSKSPYYRAAYSYLKRRQVDDYMIERYNLGYCETGKYVNSVTVSDDGLGMITAEFGSGNHAGKFIRLTAIAVGSGSIYFDCDSDIEESYRPKECVGGTSGPTELEIAQAALVTAQDNLTVAQAAVTSYMADNNAAWGIGANGRPIYVSDWRSGLFSHRALRVPDRATRRLQ